MLQRFCLSLFQFKSEQYAYGRCRLKGTQIFYIAIIAMKTGHPISYILLAIVLIIDGGLGLVKIFLKRFLKISILVNTRTPLHDHARKKIKGGRIHR